MFPKSFHIKPILGLLPYIIGIVALGLIPPLTGSTYLAYLVGLAIVLAIFAMGFNLLFGYTGLLSFGHAAYFGAGCYAFAMLMKYYHIQSFELLFLGSVIIATLTAAVIGYVCVRYIKIYFSLLTLAFGQVEYALVVKLYNITGGTDGIRVMMPTLLGFTFKDKGFFVTWPFYYYILAIFTICVIILWVILNSHFGKILQAIRDNDVRVNFLGVSERRYKWYAFILSGVFCGVAGALFAPLNGHIGPEHVYWGFSATPLFIALIGGHRVFLGPIIGSFIYVLVRHYVTAFTIYWELFFGAIVILFTLLFPYGVCGGISLWLARRMKSAKTSL